MNTEHTSPDEAVWIGFVGVCRDSKQARAANLYEDAVLQLLPRHGATVVVRAQRRDDQQDDLPAELHVIHFPSRASFEGFLNDPARHALLDEFGEVFTTKTVIELKPPQIQLPYSPA